MPGIENGLAEGDIRAGVGDEGPRMERARDGDAASHRFGVFHHHHGIRAAGDHPPGGDGRWAMPPDTLSPASRRGSAAPASA
ncbi:MAG: hypothetical protein U5L11_12265 [Arhodomonas sp.]|nr:hypothetical protein [Arhodomonas sp.]